MGANAQTKVPTFASAEVLTAANQNLLSNGIPVFSGTATRNDAFGGSGEKVLAEGQFAYLEDSNTTQYYDGAAWQSVGTTAGLTLVATGTASAAASVTVNTCFTSTYDEYLLVVDVVGSTSAQLNLQMRNAGSTITAANYQWFRMGYNSNDATDNSRGIGDSKWLFGYVQNATVPAVATINIYDPLNSRNSVHNAFTTSINSGDSAVNVMSTGFRYATAQAFDSFVLSVSSGTMTGTIRVYGYTK
jgi:hypothetical protein